MDITHFSQWLEGRTEICPMFPLEVRQIHSGNIAELRLAQCGSTREVQKKLLDTRKRPTNNKCLMVQSKHKNHVNF
jgi:hypothetical protein